MVVISGSGYATPKNKISNLELVHTYNQYLASNGVDLKPSSADFIEKASGIKSRYALDKAGILDTGLMHPRISRRKIGELSVQGELALSAAKAALKNANKSADGIDGVIVACSSFERCYPAIAIEVQHHLGMKKGWGFDMNVACSSAVFALHNAINMVKSGSARAVLVVCPELYTANVNYKDRKSHFIFGDAASALVVEAEDSCQTDSAFKILGSDIKTSYSLNIYNNFGVLSRNLMNSGEAEESQTYFNQNGALVRKEVTAMVAEHIQNHVKQLGFTGEQLQRLWLHQANIHMNQKIAADVNPVEDLCQFAPSVLDEYGNTGAAGVVIAFHKSSEDMPTGSLGVLCAFGAGYGVGSVVLEKIKLDKRRVN